MRIAFVNPPHLPGHRPKYRLPPLGLLYIATFLNKNGWEVLVYDGEAVGGSIKEIGDWIVNYRADMVAISTMTPTVITVNRIVNDLKGRLPNICTVLGGPHITVTMDEMLRNNPNIDFLIYGEGEYPFLSLAAQLQNRDSLEEVNSLIYWSKSGTIKINPKAGYIRDLDNLPFPELELVDNLDSAKYRVPYAHFSKVTSIMGSRGCPYSCTFCGVSITHGKQPRFRSPENLIKEITYNYNKYRINYFVMKDSTFTINKEWAVDFCNQLKSTGLNIQWRCNTRVDRLDKELLKLMKSAGCSCVGLGVESSDDEVLKDLKKGIRFYQVVKVLQWADEIDLETHCDLMIGSPKDTLKSIKGTLADIKKLKPDTISCSITRAYPGTELYKESIKKGVLKNPYWYMDESTFYGDTFLDEPFNKGKLITDLDLEKLKKMFYFKFYFSLEYIFTFIRRALKRPYLLLHVIKNFYPLIKLVKLKK